MFIAQDVGRQIQTETRPKRSFSIASLIWVLDALAVGAMSAFVVVNRILYHQLTVYGEMRMAQAAVVMDLLDDLLPYIAGSMMAVTILTVAALTAILLMGSGSRLLRRTVAVLLLCGLVFAGLWFSLGRTGGTRIAEPPVRATPTSIAP